MQVLIIQDEWRYVPTLSTNPMYYAGMLFKGLQLVDVFLLLNN